MGDLRSKGMILRGLLTYIYISNNRRICIFLADLLKIVHFVENDGYLYAYENILFYGRFSFT